MLLRKGFITDYRRGIGKKTKKMKGNTKKEQGDRFVVQSIRLEKKRMKPGRGGAGSFAIEGGGFHIFGRQGKRLGGGARSKMGKPLIIKEKGNGWRKRNISAKKDSRWKI